LANSRKEDKDDNGILYDLHDVLREILSEYNDTLRGKCAVCLEQFCDNEEDLATQKFTDRADFVRVDECFHRFHLICLYRDWFMTRRKEKDEFGGVVEYKPPESKRCPICRREVHKSEITYLRDQLK
jgi:hypothetical protein